MLKSSPAHAHTVLIVAVMLIVLASIACSASSSAPTTQPAQPTEAATQPPPPVKETIPVKETVPVKQPATVQPTAVPTVTPAATPTLTPTVKPAVVTSQPTKPPAVGAKLEFTPDDIEYAATKRKGDNKIQLTITLRPRGGVPPFRFNLDGVTDVQGLTFTFDWHNCGQVEPHTIMLYSADGQKVGPVGFMYPYSCD